MMKVRTWVRVRVRASVRVRVHSRHSHIGHSQ